MSQSAESVKKTRAKIIAQVELNTDKLIDKLIRIALTEDEDPRIQIAAIKELLDRGIGRPATQESNYEPSGAKSYPPAFYEWLGENHTKFQAHAAKNEKAKRGKKIV